MNRIFRGALAALMLLGLATTVRGDDTSLTNSTALTNSPVGQAIASGNPISSAMGQLPDLSKRENFSAAMQIIVLLTVLSLAPAIMLMMTSFTRIIIVLALLRQALGTQQLPPNQILIGLAMFMTFLIMGPTWQRVNNEAPAALHEWENDADGCARAGSNSCARVHDQPDS